MTPKQQRFVAEYAVDLNATQAAIRAGYSEHTAGQQGFELLKRPEIAAAVAQSGTDAITRLQVTAEMIAAEAWSIATDGEQPGSARVAALSLLAKRHREFSEKHEHAGDFTLRVEALAAVARMTAEELRQLATDARSG
jgi:phage terminase small subunit